MMRKYNFELLRLLASIAVIAMHISANYIGAITSNEWLGEKYTRHVWVTCMYDVLPRFAVPCFIMLSGTFALDDSKSVNYRYYYRKVFQRIVIPTIFFSIFYLVYRLIKGIIIQGGVKILSKH